MNRIPLIQPENASGKTKTLFESLNSKLGFVPNMARAMANSPIALEGYLALSGVLSKGTLAPRVREQIALLVAEQNQCHYCLSAHSALGKMIGLNEEQLVDSRRGQATDSKTHAILQFAQRVVAQRGHVRDEEFEQAKNAGLSDETITEVLVHVVLNILTNYFNHVADPEIDFPKVKELTEEVAQ